MSDGEAPQGSFLTQIDVSSPEFIVLCAFWVGLAIVSSYVSLESILGALPVVAARALCICVVVISHVSSGRRGRTKGAHALPASSSPRTLRALL